METDSIEGIKFVVYPFVLTVKILWSNHVVWYSFIFYVHNNFLVLMGYNCFGALIFETGIIDLVFEFDNSHKFWIY